MNIAVFASRNGSNFSAIAKAVKQKKLKVNLALLVCDNPRAFVINRAKKAGVKIALVQREDFLTKAEFEDRIIIQLKENNVELIVLAGFMLMLSKEFVNRYKGRIINIHPSLLPAFKGAQAIKDAFDFGVKVTGVTAHFVDEKMDNGPVILQSAVKIEEDDTLETLEKKIHKLEHRVYPEAINLFIKGRLELKGRKVEIVN